ncbi:Calcium/calmodulin-dependent protein kinase [Melia azedarach]|uniref:Calcium/calmodulin-dependent protein kinase n=1 Tax=Melia azedarach TaxID=155640 RepID=A0ACC1X252_MELAZ|nr:Calcium/calmodulin-dependent protein kinase [Melia azedarach]
MPQVDLETLVSACAGGSCDKKIACETLANDAAGDNNNSNNNNPKQEPDQPEVPPDFPPESFWLSKDAELDWFDRNAFYERKESQKGNSNPLALNPNPSSTSQRFSSTLKSKTSIIALPKSQKTIVDTKSKRHCKPGNTQWFPKRTGLVGKSDAALSEPSSPKVSCMGRVRSKRDRRKLKKRQGSSSESGSLKGKPERKEKTGLFSSFRMIFRSGKKRTESETRQRRKESSSRKSEAINTHDIRDRLPRGNKHAQRVESPPRKSVSSEPRKSLDGEPVGLGGMKRFTSGRRSDSWISDVA